MIPLSDDNPVLRTPIVTYAILIAIAAAWVVLQGVGLDPYKLAASVCNLGLVAGEITQQAPRGTTVPIGHGLACVVDRESINYLTPLTSMFLHGGWMHLLGNALFLWVFGNNVEDSMGRGRFLVFYLVCGLVAAAAQIAIDPASPIPMVGASGAISGVMGAYLRLYPRVRVNMLFIIVIFIRVIPLPAWLVLLYWIGLQVLMAFGDTAGGVAVMAHIGGFVAGAVLVTVFANDRRVAIRTYERHRRHPDHP
ncbi:MAG: rhomboid family intramembrane serine protease [Kofleriaceae bacterium]